MVNPVVLGLIGAGATVRGLVLHLVTAYVLDRRESARRKTVVAALQALPAGASLYARSTDDGLIARATMPNSQEPHEHHLLEDEM